MKKRHVKHRFTLLHQEVIKVKLEMVRIACIKRTLLGTQNKLIFYRECIDNMRIKENNLEITYILE